MNYFRTINAWFCAIKFEILYTTESKKKISFVCFHMIYTENEFNNKNLKKWQVFFVANEEWNLKVVFAQLPEWLVAVEALVLVGGWCAPAGATRALHELSPPRLEYVLEINLALFRRPEQFREVDHDRELILSLLAQHWLFGPWWQRLARLVLVICFIVWSQITYVIVVDILELRRL